MCGALKPRRIGLEALGTGEDCQSRRESNRGRGCAIIAGDWVGCGRCSVLQNLVTFCEWNPRATFSGNFDIKGKHGHARVWKAPDLRKQLRRFTGNARFILLSNFLRLLFIVHSFLSCVMNYLFNCSFHVHQSQDVYRGERARALWQGGDANSTRKR